MVGVFDKDHGKAKALAQRFKTHAFANYQNILQSENVDAVVVAVPHSDHDEIVSAAIRARKHVLCEKPLAIDAAEARTLAMLADEHRVKLATGFNHRFYPPVRDALRLLSSWSIGRIESLRIEIGHRATIDFLKSWHVDPAVSGGGTLMDNGPHACDLIRKFMGEVVAVKAYVHDVIGLGEACESEAFAFRNHDRAVAELRSSWTLQRGYLTIELRGSQGWLHVETAPWRLTGKLADGRSINKRYVFERAREQFSCRFMGCERSLIEEMGCFARLSSDQPRPEGTGWDGNRATEMVQAAYESARTGLEVELQPPLVRVPSQIKRGARKRVHQKETA